MGTILIGNIKGPQGSQGIQGPQGPVGPVGPTGPGADIYNGLDQTEAGVAGLDSYQGRVLDQKKLDVAKVANNLTTAGEGYALDARQGKALNDALGTTNSNVSGVSNRVTPLESKSQQNSGVGPGSSSATVIASSMYTVGNLVILQARLHISTAISNATGFPLFNIPSGTVPYLPTSSRVPGLISFHNNGTIDGTFVCQCDIGTAGESNPTKYVYQSLTRSIVAGADVDVLIFFAKS